MSPSGSDDRVTILGAGLAGSLLAVFLARRGLGVEVLEKRADMRHEEIAGGRSINLALADRGIHALRAAGVMDRVEPLLTPMPGRMLHDQEGTLSFQKYGRRPEEINYSVSRADLNRVLMDAAEATECVSFRFGTAGEDLDLETGEVVLTDETSGESRRHPTRVVFAADGAGSPIRKALVRDCGVNASVEPLPHAYKELVIPAAADGTYRIEREALHIWPRGGYMLIALPNLDGSFTVTLFLAAEGDPSFASLTGEAQVRELFEEQFPDAMALIPDLMRDFFANPTGQLGTVRCDRWTDGAKAVLLGDAAHAVVPFHGQGMNCAFEDCVALDRLIGAQGEDWPVVFAAYESERKANADAIADMALENYVEMRDTVRDPIFHVRKTLEFLLEQRHPDRFIPRYSMVMFHEEIPYAEAKRRGEIQRKILEELTADETRADEVPLAAADALVRERLEPL